MNSELPRRIRADVGPIPDSDMLRLVAITRISEEQQITFEEAEVIYDRLLDRIQAALDASRA